MSQIKIVFTHKGIPVSDFNAKTEVNRLLKHLDYYVDRNDNYNYFVCNMLVHTMLRAAYHTTHKHLQKHTTWWYENTQIEINNKMEIEDNNFWSQPCTDLEGKAFKDLFGI